MAAKGFNRSVYPNAIFPKVGINIFASSHGNRNHHLPEALRVLMTADQSRRFLLPSYDAQGGRIIDQGLVDLIKSDMDARSGQPQVIILILGSNNLRDGGDPVSVAEHFRNVVDHCRTVQRCHVVLTGVIPCPKTDVFNPNAVNNTGSRHRFQLLSTELKKIANSNYPKCTFLSTSQFLTCDDESVDEQYFVRAGVHLNKKGAELLAFKIYEHLKHIPKKTWNRH